MVVFLKNIPSIEFAQKEAQIIVDNFDRIFADQKSEFHISCSVGVAVAPEQGNSFALLYRAADIALYRAKNQGKTNGCCLMPPNRRMLL